MLSKIAETGGSAMQEFEMPLADLHLELKGKYHTTSSQLLKTFYIFDLIVLLSIVLVWTFTL